MWVKGCACSPDRDRIVGPELQQDLSGEVGHQPSAHHSAVILNLSLMSDPLPNLMYSETRWGGNYCGFGDSAAIQCWLTINLPKC